MAIRALARLATAAPAPVFAVAGANGLAALEDLSMHPAVCLQATPRDAALLLICGALREDDHAALRRLHDQLPHPRATLWWQVKPIADFPCAASLDGDAAGAVSSLWSQLVTGERPSEDDLLPDEPPAPWRGKGDHGQGGEGMMGGKPYGRPMAMTDDDRRDGLALDAYTAAFGPFLPAFPPGLQLSLTLQGDVIQSAEVLRPPLHQAAGDVPLRRIARLVRLLGLPALAQRLLRSAQNGGAHDRDPAPLLRRSGALQAIPPGLGEVAGEDLRARLRRWTNEGREGASPPPTSGVRLVDLLPGLEWSEAVLVLNSFDHNTLQHLCADATGGDA